MAYSTMRAFDVCQGSKSIQSFQYPTLWPPLVLVRTGYAFVRPLLKDPKIFVLQQIQPAGETQAAFFFASREHFGHDLFGR